MDLNMFNSFKVYSARLLSMALCVSIALPLNAQSFPKHLDKEFRKDATEQVTKAVKVYNAARVEFEKMGAQAFADQLEVSAPKAFTLEERNFLAKQVAREQLLPELTVKGDRLIGVEGGKEVLNLSTFDVAQGRFSLPEQRLIFQHNKRVIKNFENWKSKKTNASYKSSFFHFIAYKLEGLFFPQAHAFKKSTGLLIGALLGGLLGYFLPKMLGWNSGKSEAAAGHGGDLPPLQPIAPAAATPAAPATTEAEKKEDAPLTAPLPDADKPDTTKASGETESPTTTPPATDDTKEAPKEPDTADSKDDENKAAIDAIAAAEAAAKTKLATRTDDSAKTLLTRLQVEHVKFLKATHAADKDPEKLSKAKEEYKKILESILAARSSWQNSEGNKLILQLISTHATAATSTP